MRHRLPIKIVKLLFIAVWIVCTVILAKVSLESFSDAGFFQQRSKDLYNEKEYWKGRYNQTLERNIEWQIIKETNTSEKDIKYLSLGKDFDLKSNLEGLVTINRAGGEEDYRFKLIFDRNGLAIIENLQRSN